MSRVKDIRVKVIPSKIANDFVKKHHYSGSVVNNSSLHFGAFLDNRLHGVLSYGSPMMKKNVIGFVKNTEWNEMIELNRMAFDEILPKNSESRCIAISIKLLKKNAPHIKWVLSFADGTRCGDGTIYRASGFLLTKIMQNTGIIKLEDGTITTRMTQTKASNILKNKGKASLSKNIEKLKGFQLRYIYLIDKTCKLTVPILKFSEIDKAGAGMYKGIKMERKGRNLTANSQVDPERDNISPHTHDIKNIVPDQGNVNG